MLLRLVLAPLMSLAVLLLSACTNDPNKKPPTDEIDRHHGEQMQRMGGDIGGGGSM
jgi:outer membrane biogenesis lipoprotein LolB